MEKSKKKSCKAIQKRVGFIHFFTVPNTLESKVDDFASDQAANHGVVLVCDNRGICTLRKGGTRRHVCSRRKRSWNRSLSLGMTRGLDQRIMATHHFQRCVFCLVSCCCFFFFLFFPLLIHFFIIDIHVLRRGSSSSSDSGRSLVVVFKMPGTLLDFAFRCLHPGRKVSKGHKGFVYKGILASHLCLGNGPFILLP